MKALHAHGFPTPTPIDQSRHIVAMSRVNGCPLSQLRAGSLRNADEVFRCSVAILRRLAEHGLVHCDLNEFNIMVHPRLLIPHQSPEAFEQPAALEKSADSPIDEMESDGVTLIDFPQMVSTQHFNAEELFLRDLRGLRKFFATKMRCQLALEEEIDGGKCLHNEEELLETLRAFSKTETVFDASKSPDLIAAAMTNSGLSNEDFTALDEFFLEAAEGAEGEEVGDCAEGEDNVVDGEIECGAEIEMNLEAMEELEEMDGMDGMRGASAEDLEEPVEDGQPQRR